MRTYFIFSISAFLFISVVQAQEKKPDEGYLFNDDIKIESTEVVSQDRTGTCWSYATTSFLESEVERINGKPVDLSEMFQVRNIYIEKAKNYVLRQGKTQFSQGSLSHDVMKSVEQYGVVPQSAYDGLNYGTETHNHSEMEKVLSNILDAIVQNPNGELTPVWLDAYTASLDTYLGSAPTEIDYNGNSYSPKELAEELKINTDDYVTFTSFNHHPFYEQFILEVPDNWSNGSYYNIKLDEFIQLIDHALENGYSLAWDADVSEKTWSTKEGVAIIPETDYSSLSRSDRDVFFDSVQEEKEITQEYRQQEFENYNTTDDHLMHIVGRSHNQNGDIFYLVKNSWGTDAGVDGYQYVSIPYMKLKSIAIMVHKDAVPKAISKKFKQW
jgi:bleomycin hydrolase